MAHPTIVFMGTPDFAVPALQALHAAQCRIALVVTQPDRPRGRGRMLAAPPVKVAAERIACPVVQPDSMRDALIIERLREIAPDFLVVVAFGHILSQTILQIPRYGAVNLHASLLPKYRGPAPIQWALIRGETKTGVTTLLMDSGVDTGDMLLCAETDIGAEETSEQLHHRLARMGGPLLVRTVTQLLQGTLDPSAQNHAEATYAPMLRKADGRIQWTRPATRIDAFIRGVTPWPGAFCYWGDDRLKILKARPIDIDPGNAAPGTVVPGFPDDLRIATAQGCLSIQEIQGVSGKRMRIQDFLRGRPMPPGTLLS
jgi:methionyl-tRNA formyltransferase